MVIDFCECTNRLRHEVAPDRPRTAAPQSMRSLRSEAAGLAADRAGCAACNDRKEGGCVDGEFGTGSFDKRSGVGRGGWRAAQAASGARAHNVHAPSIAASSGPRTRSRRNPGAPVLMTHASPDARGFALEHTPPLRQLLANKRSSVKPRNAGVVRSIPSRRASVDPSCHAQSAEMSGRGSPPAASPRSLKFQLVAGDPQNQTTP